MIKVNPSIVFREELEGWGVLFDPDTGESHGLNAVSVLIWKGLESGMSKDDILAGIAERVDGDLPPEASSDFDEFVEVLMDKGYISA